MVITCSCLSAAINFLQIEVMAGEIWSHCAHTVFSSWWHWTNVTLPRNTFAKYVWNKLPGLCSGGVSWGTNNKLWFQKAKVFILSYTCNLAIGRQCWLSFSKPIIFEFPSHSGGEEMNISLEVPWSHMQHCCHQPDDAGNIKLSVFFMCFSLKWDHEYIEGSLRYLHHCGLVSED